MKNFYIIISPDSKVQALFISLLLICIPAICSCSKTVCQAGYKMSDRQVKEHFSWVKKQLSNPERGAVLMAAHRGDWREAPENSSQGLKNCIAKGYDILEFDLERTKDGVLVVMHDKTIDRTTNGTGKPGDYTLAELRKFKLLNATGHPTKHLIPTLEEFLAAARSKIVICIDKGFLYFDQAMELVNKYDMQNQIIYNTPAITLDSLKHLKLKYRNDSIMINILRYPVDIVRAESLAQSYVKIPHVVLHPVFNSDTIAFVEKYMQNLRKRGFHLWLNALWPEHNGGHDDDRAVEFNQPDESWGWLIEHGATIIQTDRPKEFLQYLVSKKLRPIIK